MRASTDNHPNSVGIAAEPFPVHLFGIFEILVANETVTIPGGLLDWIQVVRRHKARPAIFAHNLSLPPSIVLKSQHSQNITFLKGKLFWDLCRV
jgi:hypothetical protein